MASLSELEGSCTIFEAANQAWSVTYTPNRGRAVFAGRLINRGEPVLVERATLRAPATSCAATLAEFAASPERLVHMLEALATLQPQALEEVSGELRAAAEEELAQALETAASAEVQLLYWKWRTNGFEEGVFVRASMMNHSCRPNLWVNVADGTIQLRARRQIELGTLSALDQ